jgi:hypothetical protein
MRRKKLIPIRRETIAVIGEGITEREYFKSLKNYEKLLFKFKPDIPKHSDIWSIVSKAETLADSYDLVYCILDLDRILLNQKELAFYRKIKNKQKNIIFIENNPCFEIWFLLHYELSGREYDNCSNLIGNLKKYISDYNKSCIYIENKDLYRFLRPKLEVAIKNSITLEKTIGSSKCDIYKLILGMKIL